MKRLRRATEFLRALLRGAVLYRRLSAPLFPLALGVVLAWLPLRDAVPPAIRRGRYRGCWKCPLFNRRSRTCGDGVSLIDTAYGVLPAGCQCWLPLKTRLPEAQCFMVELGLPSRWPAYGRHETPHPVAAP